MNRICANCRLWDQSDQDPRRGQCKAKPPTPISCQTVPETQLWTTYAMWPVTLAKDWCGEFRPTNTDDLRRPQTMGQKPRTL